MIDWTFVLPLLFMAVMGLLFPSLDAGGRHARIQWWSAGVLRCLGLRLEAQGSPRPGATLLVANHVSWLDIAALHAVAPHARFVSKADVLHWPLLGWLLSRVTDSDVPYLDALPTVGSVVGQYLLARKWLENWPAWVAVNLDRKSVV